MSCLPASPSCSRKIRSNTRKAGLHGNRLPSFSGRMCVVCTASWEPSQSRYGLAAIPTPRNRPEIADQGHSPLRPGPPGIRGLDGWRESMRDSVSHCKPIVREPSHEANIAPHTCDLADVCPLYAAMAPALAADPVCNQLIAATQMLRTKPFHLYLTETSDVRSGAKVYVRRTPALGLEMKLW